MPITGRSTKPACRRRDAFPPRAGGGRLALLLGALCLAIAGCRTSGSQGPMSASGVMCRQLTQQGTNAMQRGDWARAESLLERAVAAECSDADARRNYAETLWHRGALREALAQLEEARSLAGADPTLTVRTGEVYLALGQLDEARRLASEALEMDPKLATAWALRGRIAGAAGHYREALAHYQRSLGYASDSYDVSILVAETYRQLNEPQRALVALQALADRKAPGDEPAEVLRLQGMALAALGRHEDAVRAFSRATERERPTADLWCELAQEQWMSGRPLQAQAAVEKALALDPQHPGGRALAARLAGGQRAIVR